MDERTTDGLMRALAGCQHALADWDGLRRFGVSRHAYQRRRRSADWVTVSERVIRLVGAPVTDEQRVLAAVLDAGAGSVASHRSAAALWALPGFDHGPVELSRPRSGRSRLTALATVHHPLVLPDHHRSIRQGVPVTTLARAVCDLAGLERPNRLERALQAALRAGMPWPALEATMADLDRPGRAGVAVLRALVERHRGRPAMGSGLECRFLVILRGAGLPEPRRQVDLGGERWVGRVDWLYDDAALVIEVNGRWAHSTALDVEHDQRRTAGLVAAGYTVLPISEELIMNSPGEVVRLVAAARHRLSRQRSVGAPIR